MNRYSFSVLTKIEFKAGDRVRVKRSRLYMAQPGWDKVTGIVIDYTYGYMNILWSTNATQMWSPDWIEHE
jgi:hypothetical protein